MENKKILKLNEDTEIEYDRVDAYTVTKSELSKFINLEAYEVDITKLNTYGHWYTTTFKNFNNVTINNNNYMALMWSGDYSGISVNLQYTNNVLDPLACTHSSICELNKMLLDFVDERYLIYRFMVEHFDKNVVYLINKNPIDNFNKLIKCLNKDSFVDQFYLADTGFLSSLFNKSWDGVEESIYTSNNSDCKSVKLNFERLFKFLTKDKKPYVAKFSDEFYQNDTLFNICFDKSALLLVISKTNTYYNGDTTGKFDMGMFNTIADIMYELEKRNKLTDKLYADGVYLLKYLLRRFIRNSRLDGSTYFILELKNNNRVLDEIMEFILSSTEFGSKRKSLLTIIKAMFPDEYIYNYPSNKLIKAYSRDLYYGHEIKGIIETRYEELTNKKGIITCIDQYKAFYAFGFKFIRKYNIGKKYTGKENQEIVDFLDSFGERPMPKNVIANKFNSLGMLLNNFTKEEFKQVDLELIPFLIANCINYNNYISLTSGYRKMESVIDNKDNIKYLIDQVVREIIFNRKFRLTSKFKVLNYTSTLSSWFYEYLNESLEDFLDSDECPIAVRETFDYIRIDSII